ncbi:bifunctional diaminohydroxyphosphoribosylaminopyrimidine deaminase/5-amino-6-(5-phosphoribosylamino)uracil reductase RibD [Planctomycetota bacterium]
MTDEESGDSAFMQRALLLAERGIGLVEPNPIVGCVVVRDGQVIGEGWHQRFGTAHAEVNALADAGNTIGATVYVTLEPCCHTGKTPPCTQALIEAKVQRVVVGTLDPSDKVAGKGVQQLRESGIDVTVGVCESKSRRIIAPFRMLMLHHRPWLIAKWAMTLDGKLATASKDSRWISNSRSREIVHQIRGRVDAIMIGSGTAAADDPLLTARPAGPRIATRVVVDSLGSISESSQLVRTCRDIPVLIAVGPEAPADKISRLASAGCEVLVCDAADRNERLSQLFVELGRREMTNVLCEGGSQLFGSLFDQQMVDEVHAFIAPKLVGGESAISPFGGIGCSDMSASRRLVDLHTSFVDEDVYVRGTVQY